MLPKGKNKFNSVIHESHTKNFKLNVPYVYFSSIYQIYFYYITFSRDSHIKDVLFYGHRCLGDALLSFIKKQICWTHAHFGPLILLLCISGDVSSGFQSQSQQSYSHFCGGIRGISSLGIYQ